MNILMEKGISSDVQAKALLNSLYGHMAQDPGRQDILWVTSWARCWLQRVIDIVGDDFVYTGTDSVKFVGDHVADLERLNAEIRLYGCLLLLNYY